MPDSTASNPPTIAVKIANMVFVLGVILSVLISAYAAYRIFFPMFDIYMMEEEGYFFPGVRTFYVISISAGMISVILFSLGLRLKNHVKVNLSLLFITTGITVYAIETFLEFSGPQQGDRRTKLEVLRDLNTEGVEAYPNVHPTVLLLDRTTRDGLITKERKIFPLGGISNTMMVQENENGYWMMYVADRYGFHNTNDVYTFATTDIAITGDSFAEGWSVKSDENISAVLRNFGFNVLNLGKSGNGPILEYAALKEYASAFSPRVVLWLYYENDLEELSFELASALLIRYLNEDEFSQDLILRQEEIDSVQIEYVEQQKEIMQKLIAGEEQQQTIPNREQFASTPLIKILKLRNFRKISNLVPEPPADINHPEPERPPNPTQAAFEKAAFNKTLDKANQLISNWGGRLYFVYLPSSYSATTGKDDPWREFVLRTVTELGISIVDMHKEVITTHPDPFSLFPNRGPGHYNAKGYRLVAEAIAERLRGDGVLQ